MTLLFVYPLFYNKMINNAYYSWHCITLWVKGDNLTRWTFLEEKGFILRDIKDKSSFRWDLNNPPMALCVEFAFLPQSYLAC